MEINNSDKTQKKSPTDSTLSSQSLQFIKQSLPFLDNSSQKQLSILVKVIEFKNTIKAISNNSMAPYIQAQENSSENSVPSNKNPLMDIAALMNSGLFNGSSQSPGSNSSGNMLQTMMMLFNMMSGMNQPTNNTHTPSHTQNPTDISSIISTFKKTLPDDQKNMFDMFNTLMQANSIQERNSVNNGNIQQQSTPTSNSKDQ